MVNEVNDISSYNTCGHLCKYCYANANKSLVIDRYIDLWYKL